MAGVKNTKQVVKLFSALVVATKSKKPMFLFIPKLIGLMTAACAGISKVPAEVKDMSPEEEKEVRAIVEESAGKNKDLIPDKIENIIIRFLKAIA